MKHTHLITALAASACVFATSAAVADTHWVVNGTFDDGTTLSGYFDLNVYGFPGPSKLTTQTGPALAANVYTTGASISPSGLTIEFQPTYQEILELNFANSLFVAAPTDPLLTTSYECQGSYGCAYLTGGATRFIAAGAASAPEPAAWALMLLGVAGLGATIRRRRDALAT